MSLFSLELLVELMVLDASRAPCVSPGVALRLLDFPTLLVYAAGKENDNSIAITNSSSSNVKEFHFGRGKSCLFKMCPHSLRAHLSTAPLYAMVVDVCGGGDGPATPAPPGRAPGRRTDPGTGGAHAEAADERPLAPLPRLVATASVSLAGAVDQAHGGKRGVYDLRDLMGSAVGRLHLAFRLLDLGRSSLLPHLGQHLEPRLGPHVALSETTSWVVNGGPATASWSAAGLVSTEDGVGVASKPVAIPRGRGHVEVTSAEDNDTAVIMKRASAGAEGDGDVHNRGDVVVVSTVDPAAKFKVRPGSQDQLKPTQQQKARASDEEDEVLTESGLVDNVFCPPPLFYSHSTDDCQEIDGGNVEQAYLEELPQAAVIDEGDVEDVSVEVGPPTGPVEKESNEAASVPQKPNPSARARVPVSQRESAGAVGSALSQLPLLSALLTELALLNGQGGQLGNLTNVQQGFQRLGQQRDTELVHTGRQRARQHSPVAANNRQLSTEGRRSITPTRQGRPKSVSPKPKASAKVKMQRGVKEREKCNQPPEVKKKKLMYGITNTLRLRLQKTNPDLLLKQERMEAQRKREMERLKPKAGKFGISGPKGRSGKKSKQPHRQSTPIDEYVETLIESSLDVDSPRSEKEFLKLSTPVPVARARLEKIAEVDSSSGHTWSHHEPPPPLDSSLKDLEEPIFDAQPLSIRDLEVKGPGGALSVRLPRAPSHHSQPSWNSDDDDEFEHGYEFEVDIPPAVVGRMTPEEQSSNREWGDRERESPVKYSDDYASGHDPHYSEDFASSPEPTSRQSSAFKSSPEPHALSRAPESDADSTSTESDHNVVPKKSKNVLRETFAVKKFQEVSESLEDEQPVEEKGRGRSVVREDSSDSDRSGLSDRSTGRWKGSQMGHKFVGAVPSVKPAVSPRVALLRKISTLESSSLEESQSLRTSQVSSYVPSNLSDLEMSNPSALQEGGRLSSLDTVDENLPKAISELKLATKLPGYTM
ncbi:microtubule-associated protein 10 [Petromyzon marinus]|uniref:microtubule-associated protein 10 n=1 Tax=Petromyzon marinus TaxID=7757 RepID=UPI003F7024AF